MTITLNQSGKRFNRDWIFRNCSYSFETGKSYAITGPNGSGKSTLLQCIAGATALSEGKLELTMDGGSIDSEQLFRSIAIAAPYLELIEELTATELLEFQKGFKPLMSEFTIPDILAQVQLERAANKQIRYFSSGMKQRMKLAQAIFSAVPVLLLDEPCTNLDQAGVQLYHQLMERYARHKLVVVCSNDPIEYNFVQAHLSITDYKLATSSSSRIS